MSDRGASRFWDLARPGARRGAGFFQKSATLTQIQPTATTTSSRCASPHPCNARRDGASRSLKPATWIQSLALIAHHQRFPYETPPEASDCRRSGWCSNKAAAVLDLVFQSHSPQASPLEAVDISMDVAKHIMVPCRVDCTTSNNKHVIYSASPDRTSPCRDGLARSGSDARASTAQATRARGREAASSTCSTSNSPSLPPSPSPSPPVSPPVSPSPAPSPLAPALAVDLVVYRGRMPAAGSGEAVTGSGEAVATVRARARRPPRSRSGWAPAAPRRRRPTG